MKKKTLLTTLVLGSLVVPTAFGAAIPDVTTTVTANTDGTFTATSKLAEAIHGVTNIYLGGMRNGRDYMSNRNELTPSSIILGTSESGSTAEYLTNRITSGNINMSYNKNGTSMASGMDLTGFQNSKDDKTGTYDYDGVSLTNLDSDGNVIEAKFTLDDGVVQGNENTGSRLTKNELKVFSNDESIRSTITDRTISTANDNYVFSMSGNSVSVINKTIGVDRAYLYNHGLEVRQADGGYVTFGREKVDVGNNTINRVADGIADTDAVNVRQLNQLRNSIAGNVGKQTTVTAGPNITVIQSTTHTPQGMPDAPTFNVSLDPDIAVNSANFSNSDTSLETNITATGVSVTDPNGPNSIMSSNGFGVSEGNRYASMQQNFIHFGDTSKSESAHYSLKGVYLADNDSDPINITKENISFGNRQLHDVAEGVSDTDAVNIKQLREGIASVSNVMSNVDASINNAKHESRRGIASATALAALHPLDYNPDHKVDVMGAVGHYRGNTAVALGVAYRPNENMMFTIGTSINGKDTAVNAGVSYKVGAKESTYRSQAAMAKDIEDLKAMVNQLHEENGDLKAVIYNMQGK